MKRIYLDANGSSPALATAKAKISSSLDLLGNPSSSHEHGRVMRALIDEARMHVAQAVGAHEKQVIFTSGASEANRLFVDALVQHARTKKLVVAMSPFEHPSLLKPILREHERGSFELRMLHVDTLGRIQPIHDPQSIDVLIACSAHNETGILLDLDELGEHLRKDALVMSDISQSFARISVPSSRVDILTCSAQKIGGFAGAGAMIVRNHGLCLTPPWLGGGQERGFRPGTESSLLIVGFGKAAACVKQERAAFSHHSELKNYFEQTLKHHAPIRILGEKLMRLPNTSAICFVDEDPDALRIACDLAGLSVGFGAACSGLAPEGSFALKHLGLSLREEKATVRFSFPSSITKDDIDETLERLLGNVLTKKRTK